MFPIDLDSSYDRDTTYDVGSSSASKSNRSLKSLLQSKGYEIKGKNGANYHRHDAFCINSLNLPAEDSVGVSLIYDFGFNDLYAIASTIFSDKL